jgi:hypothetical protein
MGVSIAGIDLDGGSIGDVPLLGISIGAEQVWPTLIGSPEHTIWDTPPAGVGMYFDGVDITTAAAFYRVGATDGWRVRGGRAYVPTAGVLPASESLTIEAHFRPYGTTSYPDVLATPIASKTVTVDGSTVGWKEARFDTPLLMPHPLNDTNGVVWITARWNDSPGTYTYLAGVELVQSHDGSSIYLSENVGSQWNSCFSISGGAFQQGANSPWYGIDIITDEG